MQMTDKIKIYHTEHSVCDIYEWDATAGKQSLRHMQAHAMCMKGGRVCECVLRLLEFN